MATETERKFLVNGEFIGKAVRKTEILQRYLSVDPDKTVRLRIAGNEAFLTIKGRSRGHSISRNEWEFPVPLQDARGMLEVCLPGKVVKTRYFIPFAGHTFEVDVFHEENEGLVLAEIELSFDNEDFEKPDWLGQEVTGIPEYYNANLIK
ncbi:MAG TPA: CYTH domain-containing protein [Bacteroidales bacterium]|nr:CYTH domain-containing protein [Bacteroidales bacterium]